MDLIGVAINIVQAFVFSLFSFLYIRKKESSYSFLFFLLLSIVLSIEIIWFDYNSTYEGFSAIIYSITIFIALKPIMIGKSLELIILSLILNIIISVGNGIALSIIIFLLNYSMTQFIISTPLQVIGGMISTFSIILLSLLILKSKKQITSTLTPYSNYFLGIIILLYISITFLEILLFSQEYNEYIILASWICFLSLFLLLLQLMLKQAEDNLIKTNQISISKEIDFIQDKFTKFEQYNLKLSTIRHDLGRTFFVLKTYIINSEEDKALAILDEMLKEINIAPKLVTTGNNIIDTVISSKAIDCADLKIEFKYRIDPSFIKYFREFDIAVLLLNLLSNAIENIDTVEKKITLNIQNRDDKMIIKLTNTVSTNILEANPKFKTTKNDKESHGFGILSIKNITKKYCGNVFFEQNQMIFSCIVILSRPMGS